MEFTLHDTPLLAYQGDGLAVGLFEGQTSLAGELAQLDDKLCGQLTEVIAEEGFKGKAASKVTLRTAPGWPIRKVILVGLGPVEKYTRDTARQAAANAARAAQSLKCKTLALSLPVATNPAVMLQAAVEGAGLALHTFDRFKSQSTSDEEGPSNGLQTVTLLGSASAPIVPAAQAIVSGTLLARELVSSPANYVTPECLATEAQTIARDFGLTCKILEREDCAALGMGAFLGVAQGSDMPPKFIHLTYTGSGEITRRLAIVGKGLTFDSGGLSIKSAKGMELMKFDMGGAAATLGAARALGELKPPGVQVHFIVAATENMPSGKAIHPGDILTASNGKTIEVDNTDAEGRLTLADSLVYAEGLGVDAIVDLATLTGACMVALGNDVAGLFSENAELTEAIQAAAQAAGEKVWPMPMDVPYFESMKSIVADMKNIGGQYGGAITAALFLKQFVAKTPWVHLDIAGPVWSDKQKGYINKGGTGFGVRTLVAWVLGT
ncbi:leucyl aminopeptidase [Anthocerotibacter panamensis]|uniref:leucyl aminopeptidase n=1 Tax=Anthocerotibacter panamensis TaxID=2857077 RepID=UPI001C401674|nr:leucyl aminopeptidase [Anthocerotibacter panamensis]